MSVAAMTFVFDRSEATGLERLILLCHADHAHGAEPPWTSYAGKQLVAHETRATRRGVQQATRRLEQAGRLIDTGERRGGAVVYELAVDTESDAVDRSARLAREAEERTRNRKGAKNVRPVSGDPGGEGSSPPPGEDASPLGGELHDRCAESHAAGAESRSPEPVENRKEPTAANAAAAGAPAAGSSSVTELPPSTPKIWPDVRAALIAGGFSAAQVDDQRTEIARDGRRWRAKLAGIDWSAAGAQLARERPTGQCYAQEPLSAFRYLVRQLSGEHRPATQAGRTAVASTPTAKHVDLPDSTADARDAWIALREQFEATDDAERWVSWLEVMHPVRLNGHVLEITTQPHAAGWTERMLIPALSAIARRGHGDVRFVPPSQAVAA